MAGLYGGIDPSLRSTGVTFLRSDGSFLKSWQIKTRRTWTLPQNLMSIRNQLSQIPDFIHTITVMPGEDRPLKGVAIETPFVGNNKLTAHTLSAVWGCVVMTAMQWNPMKLAEAHPSLLKRFVTGSPTAEKERIMLRVYKQWHFEDPCHDIVEAFVMAHIARCLDYPKDYTTKQVAVVKDYLKLKNDTTGIEYE